MRFAMDAGKEGFFFDIPIAVTYLQQSHAEKLIVTCLHKF